MENRKDKRQMKRSPRDSLPPLRQQIELLDKEMSEAIKEGQFTKARRLAKEQERLLERLMGAG